MLDNILLIVHFLGLAMGLSTGFANMVMAGVVAKAAPNEKAVLARFPPAMSRVGVIGLALLWASGIALVQTRYGTMAELPGTFHAKLTAVVVVTLGVGPETQVITLPEWLRGQTDLGFIKYRTYSLALIVAGSALMLAAVKK